jgi:hypothetical protein
MTKKIKFQLTILLIVILSTLSNKTNAQGELDKLFRKTKKKVEDKISKKIDNSVDNVLNGKDSTKKTEQKQVEAKTNQTAVYVPVGRRVDTPRTSRPLLSELKDEDFVQNSENPTYDPKNSRIQIAKNLLIDIPGKYPNGYNPKWRFIGYKSNLKFSREDWLHPKAQLTYQDKSLLIGDYGGKAVLRLKPYFNCECYADIMINGDVAVLTENPQVFEVGNFRKILNERSTGEPCIGGLNDAAKGGWGGKITLSANKNGDILMSLMLEDYTLPYTKTVNDHKTHTKTDVLHPSQVNYRYNAKDITIENEMSTEKANAIVIAEQEAKQRQKDYIAKTTKQADSLQKVIAKKYPQKDCRDCFTRSSNSSLQVTPTKTAYRDGYGDVYVESGTDWDINTKTEIKNKCGYDLTFIGLQQKYDEVNGYYLVEVTKTMEKGYNYRSDQGAMASLFTSFVGGGSEFNIVVQDKYYPNYARVGNVQWLRVIKLN